MIRFGLIGAGFIGGVHAKNLRLHPDVDPVAVTDIDKARAADLAQSLGASVEESFESIIAREDVDAVLIASSTQTHADYLRRATAAGKAVLCEKPIDLDFATASAAVRDAEATGMSAMMGFNRRFDRDYGRLQQAVRGGEVGTPEFISMLTRGPGLPPLSYLRVSGGQMRDQVVHFFDLLRWITGEDPVEVFACGSALMDPAVAEIGDVDTSAVTLKLPSGAICVIDAARRAEYGYDERIEVNGSTGMVEAGRQQTGFLNMYSQGKVCSTGLAAGWFERLEPTYYQTLDSFVRAVEAGDPPTPSLRDGLKALAIADAATQSLREHRSIPISYEGC